MQLFIPYVTASVNYPSETSEMMLKFKGLNYHYFPLFRRLWIDYSTCCYKYQITEIVVCSFMVNFIDRNSSVFKQR